HSYPSTGHASPARCPVGGLVMYFARRRWFHCRCTSDLAERHFRVARRGRISSDARIDRAEVAVCHRDSERGRRRLGKVGGTAARYARRGREGVEQPGEEHGYAGLVLGERVVAPHIGCAAISLILVSSDLNAGGSSVSARLYVSVSIGRLVHDAQWILTALLR